MEPLPPALDIIRLYIYVPQVVLEVINFSGLWTNEAALRLLRSDGPVYFPGLRSLIWSALMPAMQTLGLSLRETYLE